MQACDAMVLATPCETFGLVVIEAMAAGTPVIATDRCGPLEIIEDQKSGLLFEPGHAVDLAKKIEILFEDERLYNEIILTGKKKVEEMFFNDKQFAALYKLLNSL